MLDRERLTTLLTAFVKTPSILEDFPTCRFSNVPMPWWHPVEYLVNDLHSKTLEQQIQLAKKGQLAEEQQLAEELSKMGRYPTASRYGVEICVDLRYLTD